MIQTIRHLRHPLFCLVLSLGIHVTTAQAQPKAKACAIKPPCGSRFIKDVNGCCVIAPKFSTKTTKQTPMGWSAHPRAHFFSGTRQDKKTPSAKATLSQKSATAWRELLSLDIQVMTVARSCQASFRSMAQASKKCGVQVKPWFDKRQAHLVKSLALWTAQATTKNSGPDKDKAIYQLGVARMLLGQEVKGVEMLKPLLKRKDTPYHAFANATLADYFFHKGQHRLARSMYLSVANSTVEGLWSYAHLMQGWSSAQHGEIALGMQAVVVAWRVLSKRPHQLQRDILRANILDSLAQMYSVNGQSAQSVTFIEQFKLSAKAQRGWLTRLARYYQSAKKPKDAMNVYQRLVYKAPIRQRTFYGHQWLIARAQAQPKVDKIWSLVMQNWARDLGALGKAMPKAKELAIYYREATRRHRNCAEQSALRPALATHCFDALKTYLDVVPSSSGREEMLFTHAALARKLKHTADEKRALEALVKMPGSPYYKAAADRLKQLKKK